MLTSHPLYNQLTRYCLTIEDIVGHPVEMNEVVYNFVLEPTRRLELFAEKMQKISPHQFTNDELISLLPINPYSSKKLVNKIRFYIGKPVEQFV